MGEKVINEKRTKNKILILVVIAISIFILVIVAIAFSPIIFFVLIAMSNHVEINQQEVHQLVIENKEVLEEIVSDIISEGSAASFSFGEIDDIHYKRVRGDVAYISFMYSARGFLGGQYWGFYYISDDIPIGDSGFEMNLLLSQNGWTWHERGGNNFYFTEKITDNWFFWLMDFDHSCNRDC